MKSVKVLFIGFLVCLMAVASAMALNLTDRVTIAPNGKGDLLIYPAYFTGDGWESEITLINTSLTESVVAHVAIRRAVDSAERDFLVFLSPTDVFDFKITQNADGQAVLVTDDASLVIRNDCYSAADYAADHDGQPYELVLGPGWETGYVQAVAVASANLGVPPVDKDVICNDYRQNALGKYSPTAAELSNKPIPTTWVGWNDPDNILTGTIEIYNTQTRVRGALRAFALKDYHNLYAPKFGETLIIGDNPETDDLLEANNTQVEVDAVLVNDNVVVPYVGSPDGVTLFTATFPTVSGAYVGRTAEYRLFDIEEHEGAFSPPPSVDFWEMTTIIFPQDTTWGEPISRGWVLVDYEGSIASGIAADNTTPVRVVDGVPAIHTCMHTITRDDNILGVGWFYAASDMGKVLYGDKIASHYAPVEISSTLCPNPPEGEDFSDSPDYSFCNY